MAAPDLGYAEAALIDAMVAVRNPETPVSEEEFRQFVVGFARIVVAASRGDTSPRDEYLAMVIPGLRENAFPFKGVIDGLVRVAMAAPSAVDDEHVPWLIDFLGDYAGRLAEAWGVE